MALRTSAWASCAALTRLRADRLAPGIAGAERHQQRHPHRLVRIDRDAVVGDPRPGRARRRRASATRPRARRRAPPARRRIGLTASSLTVTYWRASISSPGGGRTLRLRPRNVNEEWTARSAPGRGRQAAGARPLPRRDPDRQRPRHHPARARRAGARRHARRRGHPPDAQAARRSTASAGRPRTVRAYHDHNGAAQRPRLLAALAAGRSVALVSDAGTPLVADPGYRLAVEAIAAGHAVTAVPGASALLAALAVAGLPTDRFLFAGFPPPREAARRRFSRRARRGAGDARPLRSRRGGSPRASPPWPRRSAATALPRSAASSPSASRRYRAARLTELAARSSAAPDAERARSWSSSARPGPPRPTRTRSTPRSAPRSPASRSRTPPRRSPRALGLPRREVYARALARGRARVNHTTGRGYAVGRLWGYIWRDADRARPSPGHRRRGVRRPRYRAEGGRIRDAALALPRGRARPRRRARRTSSSSSRSRRGAATAPTRSRRASGRGSGQPPAAISPSTPTGGCPAASTWCWSTPPDGPSASRTR